MGGTLKIVAFRIAQALGYAIAYSVAWRLSTDQFFLPAGLRIAALLFLPTRAWPAIFAADAAALLYLRLPMVERLHAAATWPYVSALLLSPLVSLAPFALRRRFPSFDKHERWWPLAMLGMAIWGALVSTAINILFGGPPEPDLLGYVYRFSLGQYLAVMVIALPILLWRRRNDRQARPQHLRRNSLIAAGALTLICAAMPNAHGDGMKLAALALMLAPPVVLAFLHGWRGAVLGFVAASLAIQYNLPYTEFLGAKDMIVFVAQQTLAVVGAALIVIGSAISSEFDKGVKLGLANKHALYLAQSNHLSVEEGLRRRADAMARAQAEINSSLREVAKRLKANGQYALAMEINTQGLANAKLVYDQASALYPYQIEHEGLLEFLASDEFPGTVGASLVATKLSGKISGHSVTLQLVCYRLICDAVEMLPPSLKLKVRVRASWSARERSIAAMVSVGPDDADSDYRKARIAEKQFISKIRAYGGVYRRRRSAVTFAIAEPNQPSRCGTTTQDTPLAPLISLTTQTSDE